MLVNIVIWNLVCIFVFIGFVSTRMYVLWAIHLSGGTGRGGNKR